MELLYKQPCDLHAHTKYSDGTKDIFDSIKTRLVYADILGISDHYRYIKNNDKWNAYIDEISRAKDHFEATIKSGVEIYFSDLVLDLNQIKYKDLDYIILEHYEQFNYQQLVATISELRSVFSKDIIMAHPDYVSWANWLGKEKLLEVMQVTKNLKIAIEINCNSGYFFGYGRSPQEAFEVKKNIGAELIRDSIISIGSDAHAYEPMLLETFKECYELFLTKLL